MPCTSLGFDPAPKKARTMNRTDEKLLEPLLCSACRVLERMGFDFDENPELSRWWVKHKQADEARAKKEALAVNRRNFREAVAQAALLKPINTLTKEEISILKELDYLP